MTHDDRIADRARPRPRASIIHAPFISATADAGLATVDDHRHHLLGGGITLFLMSAGLPLLDVIRLVG